MNITLYFGIRLAIHIMLLFKWKVERFNPSALSCPQLEHGKNFQGSLEKQRKNSKKKAIG